ncbi:MAG: hypothetical protein GC178_16590 [Flavobacteriales bacterium]|nr:hypothetical protein [Flavobacteriales bacterium]
MKYFIYARKSTESEDRQMASIDDQIAEMQKLASELKLDVIDVISEARSAKEPGRVKFNEMLTRIQRGEACGILCWKLNRLSRNPVDGGQISWMLQKNVIRHIQTYGRDYNPDDNVLMMQVEFGMANQYIKDLSTDVSRGMRRKAERGWFPSKPPLGYLSIRRDRRSNGQDEVIPHPTDFKPVQRLWKLMLTGNYTVMDLKREGDKLGLRNVNGKPFSKNIYYDMLRNEFYTGFFYWNNENGIRTRFKGRHRSIVTAGEFDQIQTLLSRKTMRRSARTRDLPYRGIITCGECNGCVSADRKQQVICTVCKLKFSVKTKQACPKCETNVRVMKSPSRVDHTYYRCTKNHGPCSQMSMRKEDIENTLVDAFRKLNISEEFYQWFRPIVLDTRGFQPSEALMEQTRLKKRKTTVENKIDGLIQLRSNGELTEEEFKRNRTISYKELADIELELSRFNLPEIQKKRIKNAFELCRTGIQIFEKEKDPDTRHDLTLKFASNLVQKDKKLYVTTDIMLNYIKEAEVKYYAKKRPFEPENTLENIEDLTEKVMSIPEMWRLVNSIRTCPLNIKRENETISSELFD